MGLLDTLTLRPKLQETSHSPPTSLFYKVLDTFIEETLEYLNNDRRLTELVSRTFLMQKNWGTYKSKKFKKRASQGIQLTSEKLYDIKDILWSF